MSDAGSTERVPEGEMPKQFRPAEQEPSVRARWKAAKAFRADPRRVVEGQARPYSIVIPPPNVTAALHLGHALNNTLQDVLARSHRMKGFETLWMPGTDHAGIATQTVVEKRVLSTEGKSRAEFAREGEAGRAAFVERIQAFKDEYEATITEQLQRMGCSCDWDRQRFTMDEVCARAVREAFFQLFKAGLIYRGKRLVNWDPVTQTALADDEVEMEEVDGFFYYLRYPLVHRGATPSDDAMPVTWNELASRGYPEAEEHAGEEQAWVTVATTRPETYLGDTAVAINPKDPRVKALKGLCVELPLVGRVIPVVEDDYVVMPVALGGDEGDAKAQFATGFLKVTPAHDPNDYEIGRRHTLEAINVMAPDATISDKHGWEDVGDAHIFVGKTREEARKLVVREFEARGWLERKTPYRHSVGHSYRSHVPIEPYLSDQWYVKVTDDSLKGSALRAMAGEQRSGGGGGSLASSSTSSSGGMGVSPVSTSSTGIHPWLTIHRRHLPHWQMGGRTYFITFRLQSGFLSESEREIVLDACAHWHEQRARVHLISVMPDHVHMLLTPLEQAPGEWHSLQDLLHSIKSFSSHAIAKVRGTGGAIWQQEYYDRIVRDEDEYFEKCKYVLENPLKERLASDQWEYPFTGSPERNLRGSTRGAVNWKQEFEEKARRDGRDAHPTGGGVERAQGLRFFPDRYAKTFETWHENIRDWCISRQLWWGHRIPVWHKTVHLSSIQQELPGWLIDGESVLPGPNVTPRIKDIHRSYACDQIMRDDAAGTLTLLVSLGLPPADFESNLRGSGFTQDPDVLDTWFSSALWPLSTMGWPDAAAAAKATGIADFASLLPAFNPTNVLVTGRDIITLWVSRMVMFNRWFTDQQQDPAARQGNGRLPFHHVYINPIIQDGHGQRMSKSLGNGVDPLDIIESHGADALRFVLCQVATSTQDVRLPVDLVCPHTGKTFTPKFIHNSSGRLVPAPTQESPGDPAKKMVTAFGVATGQVKATPETPLARNSSAKFDQGRNFATKLWNAARFTLSMLAEPPAENLDPASGDLSLADRWMLSRLAAAVESIDKALANYEFSVYATQMYDLLWRDFCDWYLEIVKPTALGNPTQRAILRTTLEAILRLLHPLMPFVTETIFEQVTQRPASKIAGLTMSAPDRDGLLCRAGWPVVGPGLRNEQAEREFARVQELIAAVREVRAQHQVHPRRQITLHVPAEVLTDVKSLGAIEMIRTLAGVEAIVKEPPQGAAAEFTFGPQRLAASNLADAVNEDAERARLEKLVGELRKGVGALEGRLANPGYAQRAPAHLVQQTKDELDRRQAELAVAIEALEKLT